MMAREKRWPIVGFAARVEWKPADLWIGAFVRRTHASPRHAVVRYDVWLCVVPCVPLHVTWYWEYLGA